MLKEAQGVKKNKKRREKTKVILSFIPIHNPQVLPLVSKCYQACLFLKFISRVYWILWSEGKCDVRRNINKCRSGNALGFKLAGDMH